MSSESGSTKAYTTKIVWFNAFGFLAMHMLAVYGLWLVYTSARFTTILWVAFLMLISGESVTIGAHRLFSHRSFKATWPTRLLIVLLQTIAGQNCLYIWVRDHRQHHKYSDTDADPHNARRGFFFSHIGWLMVRKHPEVIAKGKTIDLSDLEADPIVMFQKRYYKILYVVFAMTVPIGTPMLWNESLFNSIIIAFFLRYVLLLNITWLVNSAAHIYGTRPYSKDLIPKQNATVSFITFGEGWHNYHHVFPWDYKASEYGQHFNLSTTIIEAMAKLGMVYDLKEVSPNLVKNRAIRNGDGSHPVWSEIRKEKLDEFMKNCGQGNTKLKGTEKSAKHVDNVQWKQNVMQHPLNHAMQNKSFGKSSTKLKLLKSEFKKPAILNSPVLQKIFSDLGIDEDATNERNLLSSSLFKEKILRNNKQCAEKSLRTERVRHG